MKIEFEIFLKGQKTRDQRKGPLTCNGLSAVQLTILIESYIILADEIHLCVHLSKLAINTCDEVMKSCFYESCRPWSFWSKSLSWWLLLKVTFTVKKPSHKHHALSFMENICFLYKLWQNGALFPLALKKIGTTSVFSLSLFQNSLKWVRNTCEFLLTTNGSFQN